MIKTFVGPMHAAKSKALIDEYKEIYNKDHILAFKPKKDTRDYGYITSKDSDVVIEAISISDLAEINDYINDNTKIIFIDEAQMLEGNVENILALSILDDIDFYIAGLNQTSEQQPFGIMPFILSISTEINLITASCYGCGKKQAYYTYYEGNKDVDILASDEGYMPLCKECLRKKKEPGEYRLLLKRGYQKEE